MGEVLKVCRLGEDWSVKDKRGTFYGRSRNRDEIERLAAEMAKQRGGSFIVRNEPGVKR